MSTTSVRSNLRNLRNLWILLPALLSAQVGVTTTTLVDHSRTDALTKKPRTLVTEIWYPATDDSKSLPKNRYRDFFAGGISPELDALLQRTYRVPVEQLDKLYWNNAVRDARVRPGRYPLIVFSHGNGGMRNQNTFWCDHLASLGYIIVSADHTGNARHTVIDGQLIPGQGSQRAQSAIDRPQDMIFLLDEMTRWDRGADSRFAGRIDTERVAVTGMSFGSYSAIQAADAEPRFKALLGMAAAPPTHTNLTIPALLMLGVKDATIGEVGNALIRKYADTHEGPAYLLELTNGGHWSFTDMFKINPAFGDGIGPSFTSMEQTYEIINSYSAAFLGVYLKGEPGKLLESNRWPDAVKWTAKKKP